MLSYLLENKNLLPLDIFLAKRLLKNTYDSDTLLFLSMLVSSNRKGDVCFCPNSLDSSLFSNETLVKTFQTSLFEGAEKLPDYLVEKKPEEKLYVQKPFCKYMDKYYTQKNWTFETKVIQEIVTLSSIDPSDHYCRTTFLKNLELEKNLDERQKEAISTAFAKSLTLLSGGPGTGKTFTASLMIKIFALSRRKKSPMNVLLCAPTGKASFHLKSKIPNSLLEKVSIEAKTLHSLLQIGKDRYKHFKKDLYPYDLIIVDEASMIDLKMMAYLLSSVSRQTRLILIGDKNQLSPVETGQVFSEACNLKQTVYLEKTHRFSNSNLVRFTRGICLSDPREVLGALEENDPALQFNSLGDSYGQLSSYLSNFLKPQKEPFNPKECLDHMNNFQILSAKKQGFFGVDQINNWIFQELVKVSSNYFAYPIMITSNDYKKNLFNGMMGIVITNKVFPFGKKGKAYFPGSLDEVLEYSLQDLSKWELAYAISVHKSQGSEFKDVLAIIPDNSESFGKELLYTAATRAKKILTLFTKKSTLLSMVEKSGLKGSILEKRMDTAEL